MKNTCVELKRSIIGLAVVVVGVGAVAQTMPPEIEQLFQSVFQRIVVQATVVDSSGAPLDAVTVEGDWFVRSEFDGKTVTFKETVNGWFSLDRSNVRTVEFEVRKRGYHSAWFLASTEEPGPNRRLENGVHYYEPRFVLDPVMTKTRVRYFDVFLRPRGEGSFEAWDIRRSFLLPVGEVEKKTVAAVSEVQGPVIYVRRNEAGQMEVVLEQGPPDEGFLLVEQTISYDRQMRDRMRVAPDVGYAQTLALLRDPMSRPPTFFYCRLDGKFCKGMATDLLKNAAVEVYFQPDGSRYVDWPE